MTDQKPLENPMPTGPESTDSSCCEEYRHVAGTTRRHLLAGIGAASGLAATTAMFGDTFRETAYAATRSNNVLVVLSLRGGVDGMSLVVPHGDPAYYTARPTIAVPKDALVARDPMFGLHPKMAPLLPLWKAGRLAAVHAAGLPVPNRSHFAAMEEIEDADPGSRERRGWVNRLIGLDADTSPAEAVQLGNAMVPTALYGPAPVLAAGRVNQIALHGAGINDAEPYKGRRLRHLDTSWRRAGGPLGKGGRDALATIRKLAPAAAATYQPRNGATYPLDSLGSALSDTAHLIRADVGAQVVAIDYGSWDHHVGVGTVNGGALAPMVDRLAQAVAAFFTDLGHVGNRVTLVTISEFGRRLTQNGSGGLDHGWGNMMLLAGAGVAGGRYHGTWPGLDLSALNDTDLSVTTDYRDVLAEVVTHRFPQTSPAKLFPHHPYRPIGVMR